MTHDNRHPDSTAEQFKEIGPLTTQVSQNYLWSTRRLWMVHLGYQQGRYMKTGPSDSDEEPAHLPQPTQDEEEEDEPQIRRSTRARKPPQIFTYDSMGHPAFHPFGQQPLAVSAVEAFLPPAIPAWGIDSNSVVYHTPYRLIPQHYAYPVYQFTTPMHHQSLPLLVGIRL